MVIVIRYLKLNYGVTHKHDDNGENDYVICYDDYVVFVLVFVGFLLWFIVFFAENARLVLMILPPTNMI